MMNFDISIFRSNPETLTLTAVSHLVYGVVTTEIPVNDAMVTIETSLETPATVIGPLTVETDKENTTSKDKQKQQPTYKFSYWAK